MAALKSAASAGESEPISACAQALDEPIIRDALALGGVMPHFYALLARRDQVRKALPAEFEGTIDPRDASALVDTRCPGGAELAERLRRHERAFADLGLDRIEDEIGPLADQVAELEQQLADAVPVTARGAMAIVRAVLRRGLLEAIRDGGRDTFDAELLDRADRAALFVEGQLPA